MQESITEKIKQQELNLAKTSFLETFYQEKLNEQDFWQPFYAWLVDNQFFDVEESNDAQTMVRIIKEILVR